MVNHGLIRDLRGKQGLSIKEIVAATGYAKSTVSTSCRGIVAPNPERRIYRIQVNARNASQAAKQIRDAKREIIRQRAIEEFESIKDDPEMILFLGLYWGEGNKVNILGITNSDREIIRRCAEQFEILSPHSPKVAVLKLYPDNNRAVCEAYWRVAVGSARIDIRDACRMDKRAGKHPGKLKFGICSYRFSDWSLRIKLDCWLELLRSLRR